MADLEYQKMWQLCRNYSFEINLQLHHDVICTICKNMLQDVYQSPCGCRYCFQCVEEYLNGEERICPGQFDDCQNQMMSIGKSLHVDHIANEKVSMIKVKCPEENCEFTDELRHMVGHLQCHLLKCPYHDLGCNVSGLNSDKMGDHMIKEGHSHIMLMKNCIQNLRNEIGYLKENAQKNEAEIERLKESNLSLRTDITVTSEESLATIANERLALYDKIDKLKQNIKTITNEKGSLQNDFRKVQDIVDELQMISICIKIDERKQDHFRGISMLGPNSTPVGLDSSPNSLKKEVDSTSEFFSSCLRSLINVRQNRDPFEWRIENYKQKSTDAKNGINKVIFSEPFYCHSYKMQLRIYLNGAGIAKNTWISLYFAFVKGGFDDMVTWPMRREITIGLMDQVGGKMHTHRSYRYDSVKEKVKQAFVRPLEGNSKTSYYLGMKQFVNINLLNNNDRLCKGDSIVIRCLID